jgi:4-hydroxybenzoate polyprenyltransferase/phosphoserine phosphatase
MLPLYVDLDGTLIKSDLLLESVFLLIKKNVFLIALVPFWLFRGRAYLKSQLSTRVDIPVKRLPINDEFLEFLYDEKSAGRPLFLISGSNETEVKKVAAEINIFDDYYGSSTTVNLRSRAKLKRIQELTGSNNFAYAGNSSDDLAIWKKAKEVMMVNCSRSLSKRLQREESEIQYFDVQESVLKNFWSAMRPHQWLKNGLILLPLILSHQLATTNFLLATIIAFISFSLCASSVYLLNDLLDLNNDRQHRTKKNRPFAAGELPLNFGLVGIPCLLLSSILIASFLPLQFLEVLAIYWLTTTLYSIWIKKWFMFDVITLASLYSIRIIAGSAAIGVITTSWLLGFSFSLFLSLAMVKRFTEVKNLKISGKHNVEGRAYNQSHLRMLSILGGIAGLAAVMVFSIYISAGDTTQLYNSPAVLWLICPLLVFLLARIWSFAFAGTLDEDPVLFAIADRSSQFVGVLIGILLWVSASF